MKQGYKEWTKEEEEIIKKNFNKIKRSQGSKYEVLKKLFEEKGFERTSKAIYRKCQKMGLKSFDRRC